MIRLLNIISLAFRMVFYYWKSYILVTLQIAAGAFVIYSSFTIYSSIELRYKQMQDEVHALTWHIVGQPTGETDTPPITYEQLLQLKNNYAESMFPLHFVYPTYFPNQDNELVEGYFIYASDDYMKLMLQSEETIEAAHHVYMGAEIKKFMKNNGDLLYTYPSTPDYRIVDESLVIGEDAYPILPITSASKADSFEIAINFYETEKQASSENIVLLPLTAVYKHYTSGDQGTMRLSVRVDSTVPGEEATIIIMKVVSQLFNWNATYSYNVSTLLQQFLLKMNGVKTTAVLLSFIAMVCLLLVILGLTGLIHLLFNRRKQGLSILIALGARRQELWLSMLVESMFPAVLGVAIGLVVGYFYLPTFVHLGQVDISPSALGMILTAAGCLIPVFMASSTLLLRIYNMQPIKILSRE